MRDIAGRAGVSTGNAYYYFGSKEELVQEYYALAHAEHLAASAAALASEADLGVPGCKATVRALIDVSAPYHASRPRSTSTRRSRAARSARSARSPARPATRRSRLYREVVDGSSARMSREVRERLPELLWLYSMGVVLYWVHDTSDGCARTYLLIDRTVPLADRLIRMSRLPVLRSTMTDLVSLVDDLRR